MKLPSDVIDLVEIRAREHPDNPTYTFLSDDIEAGAPLTNLALARRARAIAVALREHATEERPRALLVFAPGLDFVATFYGCLLGGVIAVPAYPPDPLRLERTLPRLQSIATDAGASVILTTSDIAALAAILTEHSPGLAKLRWLAVDAVPDGYGNRWAKPRVRPDSLAFLQYTSGSTGTPKGVMVTHRNMLTNADYVCRTFGATTSVVHVCWLPTYHDMGLIAGIICSLLGNAHVLLMSPVSFLQRPLRWLAAITKYRASIASAPTFAFDLCVRKIKPEDRMGLDLSTWNASAIAAEPVRADTIDRFCEAFGPYGFHRETLTPCYGMAEATLMVTCAPLAAKPFAMSIDKDALDRGVALAPASAAGATRIVACGRTKQGDTLRIVDPETGIPCADGRVGEIWFHGDGVALGYWQRPEESRATFENTIAGDQRKYLRTGDLGFVVDGELYVTGRLKDLIIVRGRNVYPQDVEASVESAHRAIRPGCTAALGVETPMGEAVVVIAEVDARIGAARTEIVRAVRASVLAGHEIALHDVVLLPAGTIPKTSSGKIQRHACRARYLAHELEACELPEDSGSATALVPQRLTSGNAADFLRREIAAELRLGEDRVALNETLATLGIDSLAALALADTVSTALGVTLSASDLLGDTTIAELAQRISEEEAKPQIPGVAEAARPQVAIPIEGPLSCGQKALWYLHRLHPESSAYNLPFAVRVCGRLSTSALVRAVELILERHPALRTTLESSGEDLVQRVCRDASFDFERIDASTFTPADLEDALTAAATRPFRLDGGRLLRVLVYDRADSEAILLVVAHHAVADLASAAIVAKELQTLLDREYRMPTPPATTSSLPYVAFAEHQAAWVRSREGEAEWSHWKRRLAGAPTLLSLPFAKATSASDRGAAHTFRLPGELREALAYMAQTHSCTLYTVLAAVYAVLIHRYTGADDFLVAAPMSGRTDRRWRNTVGYFTNAVPLRFQLAGDPTFAEFLDRARGVVLEAMDHQSLPFSVLVEKLRPMRRAGTAALAQLAFVFDSMAGDPDNAVAAAILGYTDAPLAVAGLHIEPLTVAKRHVQFDLALRITRARDAIVASLEYKTELFAAERIERLACELQALIRSAVAAPELRVSQLSLFSHDERSRALVRFTAAPTAYPDDGCIHTELEARVAATPNNIAVVCGDRRITYAALNAAANRTARQLVAAGVKPGDRVAIATRRDVTMIIGALAAMKAGAAYVPVDPDYPTARIEFMIEDSQARTVVVDATTADLVPRSVAESAAIVRCEADASEPRDEDVVNIGLDVPASTPAYAIYTSGSTGRPKAVLVPHRCALNVFYDDTLRIFPTDVVAATSSFSFDVSVYEIWGGLCAGATVVLVPKLSLSEPSELAGLLEREHASVLFLVPAVLTAVYRGVMAMLSRLRLLVVGGDVIPATTVRSVLADGKPGRILGIYGPTEATIFAMVHDATGLASDAAFVPLGKPVANAEIYLLDAMMNPVPDGTPGEICIGGAGVSLGYWNRPDLTAERFVAHPLRAGDRVYRTGDLARCDGNGAIEFLGRADSQVKIRGYRIELGEIEEALRQRSEIQDAGVVAVDNGSAPSLVAYLVAQPGAPIEPAAIRTALRTSLPDFMIPAAFIELPALPLSPNGKLDRKALLHFGVKSAPVAACHVAPDNELEARLCALWSEILGGIDVGVADDFFDLGGDSLKLAQVAARSRDVVGVEVRVRDLLEHPSIGSLARFLTGATPQKIDDIGDSIRPHIETRPLLPLVVMGEIERVDAAALTYLPGELGSTQSVLLGDGLHNLPTIVGIDESAFGRIALIVLPMLEADLYTAPARLAELARKGIAMAGSIGASVVSLTGLLPSATSHGASICAAIEGRPGLPRLTTGHATTVASVVLNAAALVTRVGRRLGDEHVGVLGVGSIGAGAVRLLLEMLPHPRGLTLCDVPGKRRELESLVDEIRSERGFAGELRVTECRARAPEDIYAASLILGATNAPGVLDVGKLRPGTLLVDDSSPHCFHDGSAIERLERRGDVLFTEGGVVKLPGSVERTRAVAAALGRIPTGALVAYLRPADPSAMTGCMLSSLLAHRFPSLPSTLGAPPSLQACVGHYQALCSHGIVAMPPHLGGIQHSADRIDHFAREFGGARSHEANVASAPAPREGIKIR